MMEEGHFIDYYEILQISPNANAETVERMFRYFARRYHPDNLATADRDRFDAVLEAHNVLRDAALRAQYDIKYKDQLNSRAEWIEDASDGDLVSFDVETQRKMLSLFYVRRRKNIREPGIGEYELEQLLGCPIQRLEFSLWYMKEKGWIGVTENGTFAITAEGVDFTSSQCQTWTTNRRLTDQSEYPGAGAANRRRAPREADQSAGAAS
jgi:curved DNA-binding protein CbpA